MLELANEPYPPMADYTLWLSDDRADMTPEELEEQHRRDRETYRLMRERMAADPAYREARLAVSRGTSRRWKQRNGQRLDVKLLRLNRDRQRLLVKGEEINARGRELYAGERAETIRARNREWYARNRDARRAYRNAYRIEHGDELRAQERVRRRKKYAENPRKVLEYQQNWRKRNLERARGYLRISRNQRRAASAGGHFTLREWLALLGSHQGRCAYCGSKDRIEADHRVPLIRGGTNSIDNILPACRRCNRRKHSKTEEEFRALLVNQRREAATAALLTTVPLPGGSASAG